MNAVHTHSQIRLGQVASFVRGITFKPEDLISPESQGAVVCMRTKNVQEDLDESDLIAVPRALVRRDEQILREGDTLISTANSWNLVGKCCWVPRLKYAATLGGFISLVRADRSRVDPRYLYYWCTSPHIQDLLRSCGRQTTNISNLNITLAEQLPIELPFAQDPHRSLAEQKRIVAILDKAHSVREKRRQLSDAANCLIASLFRDTFAKWLAMPTSGMQRLGAPEMAEIASGVTKGRRFNGQATVTVPYIRVANVQDGYLDLSEIKTIEVLPSDVEALRLQAGDVLMTEGGDFDKLGRGAMWEADVRDCIHQNHVFRVRCNRQNLLPTYLANYIRTHIAKAYFLRCAKKTSNLASINMTQLRATPVACPPIELQERFSIELGKINRLRERQEAASQASEVMFDSLVQRAFRGDL